MEAGSTRRGAGAPWAWVALALVACGSGSTAPSTSAQDGGADAAPEGGTAGEAGGEAATTRSTDGVYTCAGQMGGDSCSQPWVDPTTPAWSLSLKDAQLTTTATGFDQAMIACTGQWTDNLFACSAHYTRAGRVCDGPLHLRLEADGSLTFWPSVTSMPTFEFATCHK